MCPWAEVLEAPFTELTPQTLPELLWGTRAWGWLQSRARLGQDSPQESWRPWSAVDSRTTPRVAAGSQGRGQAERPAGEGSVWACREVRRPQWVGTQGPTQDGGTMSPRHQAPRGCWGLSRAAGRSPGLCVRRVGVCSQPELSAALLAWTPCWWMCVRVSEGFWVWGLCSVSLGAGLGCRRFPFQKCRTGVSMFPERSPGHREGASAQAGGLWAQSFSHRLLRKPPGHTWLRAACAPLGHTVSCVSV